MLHAEKKYSSYSNHKQGDLFVKETIKYVSSRLSDMGSDITITE